MKSMMGLINLDNEHPYFQELTYFRSSATVPFAGRYRLIDFPLTNMINSKIGEIAIFTRSKFRSLMDHLGTGENWEIDPRTGGLFIFPPDWNDPSDIAKGDLRFFHNNRDYFHRGKSEYVLVSGTQFITNTNYQAAFQVHLERGSDITLITTHIEASEQENNMYRVEHDETGRVTELTNQKENDHVYTGTYIINKSLLLNLVDDCIAHHKENLFTEGIKEKINELHVHMYHTEAHGLFINSIESYYWHSMNLLKDDHYQKLFYKYPYIRTKIGSQPPGKYQEKARVKNSIIANGCTINGKVDHSILFRGVVIEEGAVVKNSIIMQRCTIKAGVHLENVILDKDVYIAEDQQLIGSETKPYVVAKRQVVSS